MSIYTTDPANQATPGLADIRHDYVHAFGGDLDDLDLRGHQFDHWLSQYTAHVQAGAWQAGWETGCAHSEEYCLHGHDDPDTSIRSNPHLSGEEHSR
ncbi:hypothetical protein [Bifidobacterium tissieri]|uniref:hypothetical protein n=1 Tax=Bifidobacterium tissieri TaxID=1630162 RepID=UPI001239FCF6|nr:hypothetical protein [Bifidobacterium tissieri]KAA8832592.1 hypothetical protein EM849_03545 [Bifidobacterium tissieri]